uniref:Uncharacterized protein n=1 Tax=Thermodesulfobacterium geofontis TaxID=1295609 RepID=A0A7V6CEL9_9BACT
MPIRDEVLREAEVIKYEGGEIPEVFFWNSYFYLTEPPPKGLGLNLTKEEILTLKKAVIERYLEIIKRDLTPENTNKSFYRGIKRAIVNLKRLKKFAEKENLEADFKLSLEKIKNWFKIFKTQKPDFQQEKLKELEKLLRSLS